MISSIYKISGLKFSEFLISTSNKLRNIKKLTHFANAPFRYSLKMSENKMISDAFRGYRNGTLD